MAQAFAVTEQIDRPVDEVWSRLTDWNAAPEWMSGIDAMEAAGPLAVGTGITFRARGKNRSSEITALTPGRSVTLTSVQSNVRADYTYACESEGASTRVTLIADCSTSGFVLNLVAPVLRMLVRRTDGDQLAELKRLIEGA